MNDAEAPRKPIPAARLDTAEAHVRVYAAVVESALDAVIVVDEAGDVVSINPAAEATFGYTRAEAVGRSIAELIVPDHMRAAHESGMARYRDTREPRVLGRRVEMDARCKDGRIIPVELAITEVELPDGRLFTANLRDLSAARAAAEEIERQREALHQNEKLAAIGSLLAGVAHELNNPLSIVLGQASILREEMEGDKALATLVERAAKIEAAAERCARVVRSFLAIARQRPAAKSVFSAVALLDASVELLSYGLKSNGIEVERDYRPDCPQVLADRDQVQNILINLVVNATQALERIAGSRRIRVTAMPTPDGSARIVVADNGPGVPAEIAKRIFEPFFTTKPQGVGTGIGLAISRGLAESQGGRLALLPPNGGGAAFELLLPAAEAQTARPLDAGAARSAPPVETGAARRRALVIDDEPEIAILLAEALRRIGYNCDIATGGREGQSLIASSPDAYDAIVCDLRMPDLDGPALFGWIKASHPALADRTLFVTGDALGPVAGRFLAECRRPVLEKPFSSVDVGRIVGAFPPKLR